MRREAGIIELNRIMRLVGLAMFGCFVSLLLVAVLVPYEVDLEADSSNAEGTLFMTGSVNNEREVSTSARLPIEPGESIRVDNDSTVRIEIIKESRAFAYLIGGADWKLVEALRRGTLFDHLLDRGEYSVIIAQQQGTVLYDFSRADPSLAAMNLILRFPDGEVRPTTPCFQATAPLPEVASAVVEVPCGGEITPTAEPTLPPLP